MRLLTRFSAQSGLAIALGWALALALLGSTETLLFLAPALLIAIPLASGRYLGEELIAKLVERRGDSRRRGVSVAPAPRRPRVWLPRGTGLIAFSLAERPPPSAALSQT